MKVWWRELEMENENYIERCIRRYLYNADIDTIKITIAMGFRENEDFILDRRHLIDLLTKLEPTEGDVKQC